MLRRLLAILLCQPGQPIPIDSLLEAFWDGQPPPTARKTLQIYVHRLRRALGEDQVPRGPTGYRIALDNAEVDSALFADLVRQAGHADDRQDLAEASRLYAMALEQWRGNAFADIVGCVHIASRARQLDEARLHTIERLADIELRLGHHADIIGWLTPATVANPFLEKLREQLILALYRSGRQADALAEYRQLRQQLVEELGVEPGLELQQLHERMLLNDPELTADPRPVPVTAVRPAVPAQLPLVPRGFTGRGGELEQLHCVLDTRDGEDPVTVVVVTGTAGVGKTATALYWGRRVAHHFPDGQLYANLRGFDPSAPAVPPSEVLQAFLGALGVAAGQIPADVEAQAALFRSLLTGRRMLIVLDNVLDAAHVRPLLPGAGPCLAVLTSRSPLTGLVAAEGAYPLTLRLLSESESWQLLAVRLGQARLNAEPEAAHRIVRSCAGLPLALAVMAARALIHPETALASLVAGLDALRDDDPLVDVRAVFSWSYDALSPLAALVFRLSALHPGPDIALPTVADLAHLTLAQAADALAELVEAQLFTEVGPERFSTHDLLRAYATELVARLDPPESRAAARQRLLDHYLHSSRDAALLMNKVRLPVPMPQQPADLHGVDIATAQEALGWFAAEFSALCGVMEQAIEAGADGYVWRIAWGISDFATRQSRWAELERISEAAIAAGTRTGEAHGRGSGHRYLSLAAHFRGRLDDGIRHAELAIDAYAQEGLIAEQALMCLDMNSLLESVDAKRALRYANQALELARQCGYRSGEADALNAIAMCANHFGDYEEALRTGGMALAMLREMDSPYGVAAAVSTVGLAHHRLGRLPEAIDEFEESIALYRKVNRPLYVAGNLVSVGDIYREAGRCAEAGRAWHEAIVIYRELGQVREDLLARVRELAMPGGQS
ncbi:AfsR/SARP family transcriptional regulator [Rhizocola hellebori]|nr:BTAD domain-containing putative transcriptional regulator [Rhizocola hellebori]